MAYDTTFVNVASKLCNRLHVSIVPSAIAKIMAEEKINLIFGSLSSANEGVYLPVLQQVRSLYPMVRMVLFLQTDHLLLLD